MNKVEALQILNGLLLGDGGIHLVSGGGRFTIVQTGGTEHIDWLLYIKRALSTLEIYTSANFPAIRQTMTARGKPMQVLSLCSLTSSFLKDLYYIWYPEHKKTVPEDICLTPVTIAHWFMGDGCSTYQCRHRSSYVEVFFATDSFQLHEVHSLVRQLHLLGIGGAYCGVRYNGKHHKPYPRIYINRGSPINTLMDMIEPHICESFRYKIKRPRYRWKPVSEVPKEADFDALRGKLTHCRS